MKEEKVDVEYHPFNPEVGKEQKRKLQEIKAKRDENEVQKALAELKKAAQTSGNVMPPILKAVKSYATLGEMTKIFKEVFGEFKEPTGL